jgi:hypothetical protein
LMRKPPEKRAKIFFYFLTTNCKTCHRFQIPQEASLL